MGSNDGGPGDSGASDVSGAATHPTPGSGSAAAAPGRTANVAISSGTANTVQMGLMPPVLEVGYNYAWYGNRYGTSLGPTDTDGPPGHVPTGATSTDPAWVGGSLDRNLKTLRQLKITKVRFFLLGNAFNYGPSPSPPVLATSFTATPQVFTAPTQPHPQFLSHFKQLLQVFAQNDMQVLLSLLDFGALYPALPGGGGGRTAILTSQRQVFLETMLAPMVQASVPYASSIFAWEVMNEPVWNVTAGYRPHTHSIARDCDIGTMSSFLQDCLGIIEASFPTKSTVGHRFYGDLAGGMPTGSMRQFHYYGLTAGWRGLIREQDPNPIPPFADTQGAFVGEFDPSPTLHSNLWPECNGNDATPVNAAFERLKVLARKGYKYAFVWPDLNDDPEDSFKLSKEAQLSIQRFTSATFPNGVP